MTKEEAEKQVFELNKREFTDEFCPLINSKCRTDCVCYMPSSIYEYYNREYTVRNAYCNNAMFYKG